MNTELVACTALICAVITFILVVAVIIVMTVDKRSEVKAKNKALSDYADTAMLKSEVSTLKQEVAQMQGKIKKLQKGGGH